MDSKQLLHGTWKEMQDSNSEWLKEWYSEEYQQLKQADIEFVLERYKESPPKIMLDIGCGLAWESRALQQAYGTKLYLIDGDSSNNSKKTRDVGWRGPAENMAFYNSLETLDQQLKALGTEDYVLIDAKHIDIDPNIKFDLIYSAISCGFHYEANTYRWLIEKHSHANTEIVFDLRSRKQFQQNVKIKEVLYRGKKHIKCLIEFVDE